MAGDLSYQARTSIFRDMLDVSQLRGRDSTGVIKVTKKLEYDWIKQVGPPNMLCDLRMYEKRIETGEALALVGHTRSKTTGNVDVASAHPFDFPDEGICGVHNGTLKSYYSLDTYHHSKVDSEVLYGHLSLNGAKDTFSKIEGAFACIWWDNKEKTLNFIRNNERPLWFTWSKDLKMMFWASEIWMFGSVGRKIELWDGGEDKKPYIELPLHTLWSFKFNPEAKGNDKILTMKAPIKIEPEEKKSNRPYCGYWGQEDDRPWVKNGKGVWQREGDDSKDEKPSGGEVTNPFRITDQRELNDNLPASLTGQADESTTTPISNVAFLTTSARKKDSKTQLKSSTNSVSGTLSPPKRNLRSLPSKNKDEHCGDTEKSCSVSNLMTDVSFRTVAGMSYVTDNLTKEEYSLEVFFENTGGICAFCKTKIEDISKIGGFVHSKMFLCTDCKTPPSRNQLVLV